MRRKIGGNVPDSRYAALFVVVVGSTCTMNFSNKATILYSHKRHKGPVHIRGLGFKFVDFLCKRSEVCHTEIKML